MNEILTKKQIKNIKSLDTSKSRRQQRLFKAEGEKCVFDLMRHFTLKGVYATAEGFSDATVDDFDLTVVRRADIIEMSSMVNAPDILGVFEMPEWQLDAPKAHSELVLALDTIQDPGNLGTIIRVADWFGVHTIIASRETVDCFSPKVVQATMGSLGRVKVFYGALPEMIAEIAPTAVYGTFLDGDSISEATLSQTGVIVIGNEGQGISPAIGEFVTSRLLIPSYPPGAETGESLNAAIATAITLAKFRGV